MMREMKGALAATVVLAAVAVACVHGVRMTGDGFNAMGRVAHGGGGARMPRPDHNDYPAMARYLVHENLWGVMGTTSNSTGLPWTNVVDMSDGAVCESTGRLLFYLTEMDETARDVSVRPKVSFSIAEAALGCGATDAEDPTCAKLTVSGSLLPVPEKDAAAAFAMIVARHPQTRDWPTNHGFAPYELHIESIGLLDFYGGMKEVDLAKYFAVPMNC